MTSAHAVNFIQPPNLLRNKVGRGGLPQEVIDHAEEVIGDRRMDIRPYLRKQFEILTDALERMEDTNLSFHDKHYNVLKTLAAIKAHGGMFGYDLVSEIAEIAMEFTERLCMFDRQCIALLHRHNETMAAILDNNIRGNGGEEGYRLAMNLYQATLDYKRYPER